MFLLTITINAFKVPNRLDRTDYLFKNIYLGIALIIIFSVACTVSEYSDAPDLFSAQLSAALLFICMSIPIIITKIRFSIARLHDLNRTGCWIIPIILLLIFTCIPCFIPEILLLLWPSTKGSNRFGEEPPKSKKLFNPIFFFTR